MHKEYPESRGREAECIPFQRVINAGYGGPPAVDVYLSLQLIASTHAECVSPIYYPTTRLPIPVLHIAFRLCDVTYCLLADGECRFEGKIIMGNADNEAPWSTHRITRSFLNAFLIKYES
jgi:hypothetical protein